MNCLQTVSGSSGRATQCASGSTADALDDEDDFGGLCSRPPRYIGAPLISEAASKVDKCLARLQSLQGTVAVPKVHVSSSSVSANTLSPIFNRSRSCLHRSPKKAHENDKIRIHDVLRWSDDFSGKYKQDRREKYMRRLSHSKTQVFDDKKDPLDPHGEWKHWSSPAGDVHKVISEILMASQIAKQITSMVNAAIVQSDNSSDESGKKGRRQTKDTVTSPNPMTNRKGDPLHKFRVVLSADGPAKKRSNVGSRKEVLYPKSKQPIPDRCSIRSPDENEVTSSTAKRMLSRRLPRAAAKETRPQEDLWSAKDVTNSKAQKPQADLRAAKDLSTSKSQRSQSNLRAAKEISTSKSQRAQSNLRAAKDTASSKSPRPQSNLRAAKEMTHSKSQKSQSDLRAPKETAERKPQRSPSNLRAAKEMADSKSQKTRSDLRAAKDMTHSKSPRPQADLWAAKDMTHSKSQKSQAELRAAKEMTDYKSQNPQADLRAAKDLADSKSQADLRASKDMANTQPHHLQGDTWAAKDVTNNSRSHRPQANVGAARDITDSRSHQSGANTEPVEDTIINRQPNQSEADICVPQHVPSSKSHQPLTDVGAPKEITTSQAQQSRPEPWAAKEIINGKSHQAEGHVRAAEDFITDKSQRRAAPWPESKKLLPVSERQPPPYTVTPDRSSRSPPRSLVEKPQLGTTSSKPSFLVEQGSRGPKHICMEPRVLAISSTTATSEINPHRQPSSGDTFLLPSKPKDSSAAAHKLQSATESPLSVATTSEIKHCISSPSALPVIFSRPRGSVDAEETISISAASPEIKMCNPSQEEFNDPALDGFNVVRSTVPESITCSGASSPQLQTPVKGPQHQQQPIRSNPLIGSLRHKFVMEATEIKARNNSWRLSQPKSNKAVLFSNPAFAPASPQPRAVSEIRQRPVAISPPKSPPRSTSATRRVFDRIGRALSAGRRSISPEITRRLNSTRQKLSYLSPGKSLPSLISRLPSRGKRKPSPVPRPSIIKSTSCTRPAPPSGELPLPPGRKPQQHLPAVAQQAVRIMSDHHTEQKASPGAASTDSSSYFSLRMLKDLNCNAQQVVPLKGGSKGTTSDIAPRTSVTRNNSMVNKCHASLNWENEMGAAGVLSSCQKWVQESAPPPPGGVPRHEKENVEPPTQRILIKENVVATGWDEEAVAPAVLSTSRSRKTDVLSAAGGTCATPPRELKSGFSGVRRSFSTGRIRSGTSFLKRARDWMRTQTPNRMRTQQDPNFDQPREEGLVI